MNVNIKQKLAGKSAYIALAILLLAIILFTVLAIIAAVNARDEVTEPPVINEIPDPDSSGDQQANGNVNESDVPSAEDTPQDTPPASGDESAPAVPVYLAPCDGYIQKDYSDTVLVFSQSMNDHRVHLGIDISGNIGDPVKAFSGGTVERIYADRFMGNTVIINHGNGLRSVYMNLGSEIPDGIKEGAVVKAGAVIGSIGESATSECMDSPHLHFEIRLGESKVNPQNYVTLPSSSKSDEAYEG